MKKESVLRFTKAGLFLILFYAGIFFRSTPFITISASLWVLTLFERYLNIKIPTSFSIVFVVFVVLSLVLWSYADFYEKFPWWDDMLHFSYCIWFSLIWYLIIYYLYYKKWVENDIFITVAFSFCFTVAFWAIWEIYEYSIDSFFLNEHAKNRDLKRSWWYNAGHNFRNISITFNKYLYLCLLKSKIK